MCHGGWCFRELCEELRHHGHRAVALTLTGLAERAHLLDGGVNLDTHIRDVAGVLEAEDVRDAVLVGHSYGGMVITGVADRLPGRMAGLVYLDVASLLQPLRLTGDPARIARRVYVYAAGWQGESPFTATYERLREDPAWTTYALDGGHNLMRDAPEDLLKILTGARW
ncbi:alpha/beta fold hydrolase [Microbispora bryophytorum]|uniref:Alpha/beta hydrolase n=1 Tax=Microbispora bryophytorum subsp. camponoti TaxID=1677852 RepID=A0ABR8KW10_9ACTN|nr:alpha/beta hydrolase [Microbispora camponoti]MBD3142925.1 alpha/beta hydrolase [Microbispora camponoti]